MMATAISRWDTSSCRWPGRLRVIVIATPSALLCPGQAWAHGAPLGRRVGWQDWNWDPVILLNLAIMLWLYGRGWAVLRYRGGLRSGRQDHLGIFPSTDCDAGGAPARPAASVQLVTPLRGWLFVLGMAILSLALISPLDPLGEQLGWAHMVQHMILMTIAAPLLVAAAPGLVCWCGLPPAARHVAGRLRRMVGRVGRHWLWNPLVVWSLYAIVTWIWHVPAWYQAALRIAWIHDLQHLSFFIAGCLFWRLLLDPISRLTLRGALAVLFLFTTTLHATVLGVFMTVAPTRWYAEYDNRTHWWGLTALEDQQLAGLIMWMPACAAYALVAIGLFAKALQEPTDEASGTWCKAMVTP